MKGNVFCLAVLLSLPTALHGAELVWDYMHGWTPGFVLQINTETGKVRLHDRTEDVHRSADVVNGTNVVAYIKALLDRIPGDSIGEMAIDGEISKVTVSGEGTSTGRTIYSVSPPGIIPYNEGYLPREELKDAETFRKNLDGFLIRDMLFQIKRKYFKRSTPEGN